VLVRTFIVAQLSTFVHLKLAAAHPRIERGRKLFLAVKGLSCVKCHAVGGQGGKVGPDVAGIALRYNVARRAEKAK
jgi:hypothetical protein